MMLFGETLVCNINIIIYGGETTMKMIQKKHLKWFVRQAHIFLSNIIIGF